MIPTRYKHICVLAINILKIVTWVAVTCRWSLRNKNDIPKTKVHLLVSLINFMRLNNTGDTEHTEMWNMCRWRPTNRPVTRQPAGEIHFRLIKRTKKKRVQLTNSLHYGTDTARSWTLWATAVLQTAATSRFVYFSTNARFRSTYPNSGSQTDGLDFSFLYWFPKRNLSSLIRIVYK